MNSIRNDRCEAKIAEMFNTLREGLRNRYYKVFSGVGVAVDDALATAFEYTAKKLLVKSDDFGVVDFESIINWRMRRLVQDAIVAAKRTHGRRSVKPKVYFDEDSDEDVNRSEALMNRVSLVRHSEGVYRQGEENRFLLQSIAIEVEMKKNGTSERDYKIFDRSFFCAADRKALAAEFGTSVSNINRICCECSQRARRITPQIRTQYSKLKKMYGLEAA